MNYPKYVIIDGERYDIDTDFRTAIKCSEIINDEGIGELQRALGVIYMLFGDKGLDNGHHHGQLLEYCKKFLGCGKEIEESKEEPDMDYVEDMDYIEASFMSDFNIDLENTDMHWWKFCKLMDGLSNSELGNCCVLNAVRNLRNTDLSKIKDDKVRQDIFKAKERVALKKNQKKFTDEELKAMEEFNKIAGI